MDLVQVLSALGNVAVIVGIVVALLQLRSLANQRQEDMVLRAHAPFIDPAFQRAFWVVQSWPYTTLEQFEAEASLDDRATLDLVSMHFVTMGLLYRRGLAKLDFLDDLTGVDAIMTWNKIAPIVYGFRRKYGIPGWSRWHEDLVLAIDKRKHEQGEGHPAIVRPGDPTSGTGDTP